MKYPLKPAQYALFSALFFALLLFLFHSFVFDGSRLLHNADQLKSMGSRYLTQGMELPEWDSSKLGGLPTLDAMFGDAYHPLRLLQGVMEPARAVGWKFILSIQFAFMGGLLLFSRLARDSRWGALIALFYALNPHFFTLTYPGHDGKMMALSALPWLLWGLLILAKESKAWGAVVMALALLWMVLSSHLQVVYFVLWGLLFLSFFLVFFGEEQRELKTKLWNQALVGVAVAAALGLSAFQIIPQRAYLSEHSVRGSAEKSSYGHAVSWSLHPEELATLILPGFISHASDRSSEDGQGITEKHYWGRNFLKLNHDGIGAMLLLLGLLGLSHRSLRREGLFWIGASTLVVIYTVGAHTPLFSLFYKWLPGVHNFRAPAMAGFWLPMGAAWMGARWLGCDDREKGPLIAPLAAMVAIGLLLAVVRPVWNKFLGAPAVIVLIALFLLTIVALGAQMSGRPFGMHSFREVTKNWKAIPPSTLIVIAIAFAALISIVVGVDEALAAEGVRHYFVPLQLELMKSESPETWISWILLALSAGALIWAFQSKRPFKQTASLLLVVGVVELLRTITPYISTVPMERVLPSTLQRDWSAMVQKEGRTPPNDYRLLSFDGINDNLGSYVGFRSLLGFHDNELDRFRTFTGGHSRSHLVMGLQQGNFGGSPFLNLLNTRYIFTNGQLFANSKALPRVKLYDSVQVAPASAQLALLKASAVDEQSVLLLEESPAGIALPSPKRIDSVATAPAELSFAPAGTATILSNPTPDHLIIQTKSDHPTLLFYSENWMPGWSATVNGSPAPVLRAYTTLQAVPLPAGENRVELRFHSLEQDRVKPLIAIGGVLLLLLIINSFLPRRKVQG